MTLDWKIGGLALGFVFFIAMMLVKPIGVSTQFVILDGVIGRRGCLWHHLLRGRMASRPRDNAIFRALRQEHCQSRSTLQLHLRSGHGGWARSCHPICARAFQGGKSATFRHCGRPISEAAWPSASRSPLSVGSS